MLGLGCASAQSTCAGQGVASPFGPPFGVLGTGCYSADRRWSPRSQGLPKHIEGELGVVGFTACDQRVTAQYRWADAGNGGVSRVLRVRPL